MRGGVFLALLLWAIAGLAYGQTVQPAAINGTQYLSSTPTLSNFQKYPFLSDSHGDLLVNCVAGCSGGGGGSNVTIVAPLGSMLSANAVSVVPASDWLLPPYASTPTFNLGTLNGAATAANQSTEITALGAINTTLGSPFQAGGSIGNTTFAVTQGTSPWVTSGTSTVSGTVTANQGTSPWVVGQSTASALNATVVGTGTFAVQAMDNITQVGSGNVPSLGTGILGTTIAPTATAAAGIAQAASSSIESNHVFKGSAGQLYTLTATVTTVSGYLMIFNATSAPVDGAVTPAYCVPISSNGTNGYAAVSFGGSPMSYYSTGITAVFSSTGCFTKTASATAYFTAQVQ